MKEICYDVPKPYEKRWPFYLCLLANIMKKLNEVNILIWFADFNFVISQHGIIAHHTRLKSSLSSSYNMSHSNLGL